MNKKQNSGVTLVELLIYLVLAFFVVSYALNAMADIAKNYVHGREITKMQMTGRDAINMIARDLTNTGFKYCLDRDTTNVPGVGDSVFFVAKPNNAEDRAFLKASHLSRLNGFSQGSPAASVPDSAASFQFWDDIAAVNPFFDSIEIFKAHLAVTDSIDRIERVKYCVRGDTLWRIDSVRTGRDITPAENTAGKITWTAGQTVAVATGILGLQFEFSEDGTLFTSAPDANERHLVKHIKISLLKESDRKSGYASANSTSMANKTITGDGIHLNRPFTQIVPIPNNGILK